MMSEILSFLKSGLGTLGRHILNRAREVNSECRAVIAVPQESNTLADPVFGQSTKGPIAHGGHRWHSAAQGWDRATHTLIYKLLRST